MGKIDDLDLLFLVCSLSLSLSFVFFGGGGGWSGFGNLFKSEISSLGHNWLEWMMIGLIYGLDFSCERNIPIMIHVDQYFSNSLF